MSSKKERCLLAHRVFENALLHAEVRDEQTRHSDSGNS